MMNRRSAIATFASITLAPAAFANDFPGRQVSLVVVFPPGGPGDLLARQIAPALAEKWGSPVVVENKPGAAGSVAALAVLREPADGHTLLFTATTHIQAVGLKMKLSYDPLADFTPVSEVAVAPLVLMVREDGPRTLQELIDRAKSGQVNFSSFGAASTAQIYGQVFNKVTGTQVLNVPYPGGAPQITALLGGQVQGAFIEVTQALPYYRAGKLRPLAMTGTARYPYMPDVKTFEEQGLAGFELVGWHGVLARKGVPSGIAQRISGDIAQVLHQPAVKKRLTDLGVVIVGNTPAEFGAVLQREAQQWTALIERSGVSVQ